MKKVFWIGGLVLALLFQAAAPALGAAGRPEAGNPPAAGTYIVQPGDSLYRIAARQGVDFNALMAANGFTSAKIIIYPGEVLNLPGGGVPVVAPGGPPLPAAAIPSSPATASTASPPARTWISTTCWQSTISPARSIRSSYIPARCSTCPAAPPRAGQPATPPRPARPPLRSRRPSPAARPASTTWAPRAWSSPTT